MSASIKLPRHKKLFTRGHKLSNNATVQSMADVLPHKDSMYLGATNNVFSAYH